MPADLERLTAREFSIAQAQIAAFTPDEEASPAKLQRSLLPRWDNLLDGEPFVLPFSGPMPREVPRVILQAKTSGWRCEISSERISVAWQKTAPESTLPTTFIAQAVALVNEYAAEMHARVGRLAAVLTRFAPHPRPGLYLAQHFCQPRWIEVQPFNRPENFELHAHKVFPLAGVFRVNSWVRCKTAVASGPQGTTPGVSVEHDINTPHEEASERAFSPAQVEAFCSAALPAFDEILGLYFPVGGP